MEPCSEEPQGRQLSEEDIDAITNSLRDKIIKDFYQNLGRGVWALAWKAILIVIVGIAIYGAYRAN